MLLSSNYPPTCTVAPDVVPSECAQKLLDTLVRVAAAKGPRRLGHEVENTSWLTTQVLSHNRHATAHTGMPRVELDGDQRDALIALGALIRGLVDAMYLQGRKDGRDLLGGLASGRISVNDFADRDAQWRADEEKKK